MRHKQINVTQSNRKMLLPKKIRMSANMKNSTHRISRRKWINNNKQHSLYSMIRTTRNFIRAQYDRVKYRFGNLAKRVIHKIRNSNCTRYIAHENNYSKQSNDIAHGLCVTLILG